MAYSEVTLRETSSDVCELSDGLEFLGAPVEILRTGSPTTLSAFSKAKLSLSTPSVLPGSRIRLCVESSC